MSRLHNRNSKQKRFLRKIAYKEQKGLCAYCKKYLKFEDATLDHITPLSKGGNWKQKNLQITCVLCNNRKGSILHEKFIVA